MKEYPYKPWNYYSLSKNPNITYDIINKTINMNFNTIKVLLAVILFLCIFDMPYDYYQFVRIAATLGFAHLAYSANKQNLDSEVITYLILVLVFQPFATVHLNKITWNVIDLVVAVGLLMTLNRK